MRPKQIKTYEYTSILVFLKDDSKLYGYMSGFNRNYFTLISKTGLATNIKYKEVASVVRCYK